MKRYTIIGGDLRNLELAKELKNDNNDVAIYGFLEDMLPKELISQNEMEESKERSDIVILPILITDDNRHINTPFGNTKIKIIDVIDLIKSGQTLIAGKISSSLQDVIVSRGALYINILENEEMAILNATITAESAIGIVIQNTNITLHQNNCMVLGFGRIGKNLSKMLQGIGSNVYVGVRKKEDLAWIKSYNYNGIVLQKIGQIIGKMDVIFNTIPKKILCEDTLANIKKQSLIIDLAQGIDMDIAKKLGFNALKASGLPGKMAPKTSAKCMKEVIYSIKEKR